MPTQKLVGPASADLVLNSCMDTTNSSNPSISLAGAIAAATRPDENTLLNLLKIHIASLNESINIIQRNFSNWNIYSGSQLIKLQQSIAPYIIISQTTQRNTLSETVNARLNFTSQLAVFANFLKAQETDASYGEGMQPIKNVVKELVQTICMLKNLLQPQVSNDDLRAYVTENCNLPELNLMAEQQPLKRAVTFQVLRMMTTKLNSFQLI